MKTTYEMTIDDTPTFIPWCINKNSFDAVRDYVYRLRSDYHAKKIELWETTQKLVDL